VHTYLDHREAALADYLAAPGRRGAYMGIWVIFFSLGTLVTSSLAPVLAENFGYNTVWLVMAIGYFFTVVVIWALMPETRGMIRAQDGDASPQTTVQIRTKPSIRSVLSRRNVWVAYYSIFAFFCIISVSVVLLNERHLTDLNAAGIIGVAPGMAFGILMSMFGLASILLNYHFGRLADSIGSKKLLLVALGVLTLQPVLISFGSLPLVVIGWVVGFALAGAVIFPAAMALLVYELEPHERGVGMGFFMLFPTLATAAGQPLFGFLGDTFGVAGGIRFAALFPMLGVLAALFILPRERTARPLGRRSRVYVGAAIAIVIILCAPLIMLLSGTMG